MASRSNKPAPPRKHLEPQELLLPLESHGINGAIKPLPPHGLPRAACPALLVPPPCPAPCSLARLTPVSPPRLPADARTAVAVGAGALLIGGLAWGIRKAFAGKSDGGRENGVNGERQGERRNGRLRGRERKDGKRRLRH